MEFNIQNCEHREYLFHNFHLSLEKYKNGGSAQIYSEKVFTSAAKEIMS